MHPERPYVLLKMLDLENALSPIKFDLDIGNLYNTPLFFCIRDKKISCDFNKLTSKQSYGYDKYTFLSRQDFKESSYLTFFKESGSFNKHISSLFPAVYDKLKDQIPDFTILPNHNQNALVYSSEEVPEWFKGIRNTHLYLLFLAHESVLNPCNPNFDSSLEFQIEKNQVFTDIKFAIKGITPDLLEFYPSAKKHRLDENYRYDNLFRPIQDPRIAAILHQICHASNNNEKAFLSKSYPDELAKTLQHITINKKLQISEAYAYFAKNPAKLADPDFQVLFEIFFFRKNLLAEEMQIKGFADNLGQFFTKQYRIFLKENNIQTAVFLLKMMRLCGEYCPNNPHYPETLNNLRSMLRTAGLSVEEKSVIYAELVSALSKKDILDPQDVEDLLIGSSFLEKNPVPQKWMCPETDKNISQAVHIHASRISAALLNHNVPNQALLQKISKEIIDTALTNWKYMGNSGGFPKFANDGPPSIIYNPLNRRFSVENTVRLPREITENIQFKQLFKNYTHGYQVSEDLYELNQPAGTRTLLHLKGSELTIEQQRDGKWHRFMPHQDFIDKKGLCSLNCIPLAMNFDHWSPLDNPLEINLVDPKTNQTTYRFYLTSNAEIAKIVRLSDGAVLGDPSGIVQTFESPLYVLEWYKDGKLIDIELPRYDLTFTNKKGKLYCNDEKYQGFFISQKQYLRSFGSYHHYLVLENEQGIRKVLIPEHYFEPLNDDKESLKPLTNINMNASPEFPKQSYMSFDVSKDGNLKSHSRKNNLFLAYIFLSAGEYAQAAKYLNKFGNKLSAYTEEEENILSLITNMDTINGDEHGNAISIRLYAHYLLLKNCFDHNLPTSNKFKDLPLGDYLKKYHHITELKLKKHEELLLLKFSLKNGFDAREFIRLTELDPEYASQYILPVNVNPKQLAFTPSFLSLLEDAPSNDEPMFFNINTAMVTRINPYIKFDFFNVYNLAMHGTVEEKKWLKQALIFGKFSPGPLYSWLIECVMENPGQFPVADTSITSSRSKILDIWPIIIKKAEEVGGEKLRNSFIQSEDSPALPNYTPPNFHLDPLETKVEEFKLSRKKISLPKSFSKICTKCFQIVKDSNQNDQSALQQMLANEVQNPSFNEPLYKEKFAKIESEGALKKTPSTKYTISSSKLKKIEKILKSGKQQAEKRIAKLEEEILEIGNQRASKGRQNILERLAYNSGNKKVLTLEELLVYYARQNTVDIQKRNPNLDPSSVNCLFERIEEFLVLKTHEQQRARASQQLDEIKKCQDSKERDQIVQQLATTLLDTHHYELHQFPAYLVFEYYANILLRPSQIGTLEKFLKNGDLNPIMEMIMGSGKSKVLLPLLGLLRADGKTLSMIVVPTPLFEDVSSNTQEILSEAFALPVKALHFNRNTTFTADSLKVILEDLNRVCDNKECLIMTSKGIECLILKFIDQCNLYLPKGEFPEELQTFAKILLKLAETGHPLIDEADTILNVLHEVCFSLGVKQNVARYEAQTIAMLYEILYTNPQIKALGRLDSDMNPNPQAPPLTEELYHQTIKVLLAKKFLARAQIEIFEPQSVTENIQNFVQKLNQDETNLMIAYLTHDPARVKEAQSFFDKQNDDVKNVMALAAEQISLFLPHTLCKSFNKKYGMDPNPLNPIAIPYSAANTPNVGSQFANHYVTMNYTFQYYVKAGIEKKVIWKEIEHLQSLAIEELKANPNLTLEQTKAWHTFCKIKKNLPIPLFNIKEAQLDELVKKVNNNPITKLNFVLDIIVPHLEIYSHKISCDSHNLAELFRHLISGFTGTLWNSKSMHRKFKPFEEQGIEFKTISLLRKEGLEEVYVIKEGSTKDMLKQLRDQKVFYDLMTDAGGYFKEGGNATIAKETAKENRIPVVFYNSKNEQTETDGDKEIPLTSSKTPMDKRQTFLDQSHFTGADVPQKIGAVGIVTIDSNMLFRDLLQAVWRLRGLETKGQHVKFVLTEEVESIIKQKLNISRKPNFDDILRFTIINQVMQQGKDNFKGAQQELACTFQSVLLQVVMSDTFTIQEKQQAFDGLKDMWIQEGSQAPKDLYGTITQEEASEKVLDSLVKKYTDKVKDLYTNLPFLEQKGISQSNMLKEISEIGRKYTGSLSAKVLVPIRSQDSDQTTETETETEQQVQVEVQEQQVPESVCLGHVSGNDIEKQDTIKVEKKYTIPYFSFETFAKDNALLKKYADAFEGIYLTMNVLEWPEGNLHKDHLQLLGNHRLPIHFVKVVSDEEVVILSQNEAKNSKNDSYNLGFGFYDPNKPISDKLLEKITKIEFLNGESSFSLPKQDILKKWFAEQGLGKMQDLYLKHIIAGSPEKTAAYSNSHLKKIFEQTAAVPSA